MAAALRQGVERVVYTSSVAVLGKSSDGAPADADTAVCLADMIGAYHRSNFLAEEAVCRLQREAGLPVVIVIPSNRLGQHDVKPPPTGRLVTRTQAPRVGKDWARRC